MTDRRKSRRKKKNNGAVALIATAVVVMAGLFIFLTGRTKSEEPSAIETAMSKETGSATKSDNQESTSALPKATEEFTVKKSTTIATVVTEAPKPVATKKLYTITNVNIRTKPSTSAEILGQLAENTEVDVVESYDDKWTEVVYEGEICFVASEYLTDDKDWQLNLRTKNGYRDGESISLYEGWKFADFSEINAGNATMHLAKANRKGIIVGINAGHGTEGGSSKSTYSHPDKTGKVTGGTNANGAVKSMCVSSGMTFEDGTLERTVTLKEAQILKEILLERGYDILMIREDADVQLDNVARTVICNNVADCHIAIHWDGDGLDYDKGCFYMSVPDALKYMDPVATTWQSSEALGESLIDGLSSVGCKIFSGGSMDMDLTQTSFSTIPSVDIELGNQSSNHGEDVLYHLAEGIACGVDVFFGQ